MFACGYKEQMILNVDKTKKKMKNMISESLKILKFTEEFFFLNQAYIDY